MTTAQLAPKPVRKRRARKSTTKPMTEQKITTITPIKDAVVVNQTKRLSKPEKSPLSLEILIDDFNTRIAHDRYERQELVSDCVHVFKEAKPWVMKGLNRIKEMTR